MSTLLFPLPETHSAAVMADLQAFVKTPAANPPVLVVREPLVQDVLDARFERQEQRRYLAMPHTPTGFGVLT
jgi:hypothetical protein